MHELLQNSTLDWERLMNRISTYFRIVWLHWACVSHLFFFCIILFNNNHTCVKLNTLYTFPAFTMEVDSTPLFKSKIRHVNHPGSRLSYFVMQQTLAWYEEKLKTAPTHAAALKSSRMDIDEGVIYMDVLQQPTQKWLELMCPVFQGSDDKLVFEILPENAPKPVKISIKMVNIGEINVDDLFAKLKCFNPNVDFSSWRLLENGYKDLGKGYILLFMYADPRSIEPLKDTKGNYVIKAGITGCTYVKVYGLGTQSNGTGEKRKIGFNAPLPQRKVRSSSKDRSGNKK